MPEFAYIARDLNGQDISGQLKAPSERDATSILADRALFVLKIEDTEAKASKGWQFRKRVRAEQVASCLTQLSDLLQNGVPLLGSLKLLAEESANPTLGEVMQDVHDQVAEGITLEDAMAKHPRVFSDLTISMVRAGSEGAFLEEALTRVASFLEMQEEIKGKVKGAMAYPSFLMVGGIAVTLLLVVFFVPKFEGLFDRLERQGTGLPLATHILLGASDFLLRYGLFVAAAFAGIVYGLQKLLKTDAGTTFADKWKLKLPIVGSILHDSAVSRFCRVLGTLLTNGVPILRALEISSGSVGNRLLEDAIVRSADNISSGETLSAPLAKSGLIPPSVMAMIRIAEESNNLDRVLVNVADAIDSKMDRKLNLMVRLIEPVMLVIIGCAILFVLVALLLPVFDMSSSV